MVGSGIRKKPIPDPGSGGKKVPDPGSRIRIRNTDDDMIMSENQSADHKSIWQRFWVLTKQCSRLSLSRPTMTAKHGGGGQLSPYTSHIHKYRHLSGPGRDSHLPVDHSYKSRVPLMHVNLKLLFCDWGRQISLVFIFLPIHYVLC